MTCKTWNLLAQKYFNPLCTNRFFPDASTNSCPLCVAPYIPRVVETPCSEVILPDKTKTYMLVVKTPASVSFSYPGLSPWKDDLANPSGSYASRFASGWPSNIITSDPLYGYEFWWNHGASGNIWGAQLITDLDPIKVKSAVIQPGYPTVVSSKVRCGYAISKVVTTFTEIPRATTISPPVDSFVHPQVWTTLNQEKVQCRVTCVLDYWAETPDLIGGPYWDDPATTYNVMMSCLVEQTSSLQNGAKLLYSNRSGSPPWGYGAGVLGVSVDGFFERVSGSSPGAVTFASYRYSTTDRAAFLAASSFSLTKQPISAGYTPLATPNSTSTITGTGGYVLSVVQQGGSFPGWSTIAPSSGGINTQFSDGGPMATGWPDTLVVLRKEV